MKKVVVLSVLATMLLSACSWGGSQWSQQEVVQTNANYMVYTDQDFANVEDSKVLFFHAKWCPDCVEANKNIAEFQTTPNVKIYKVDFDNSTELRKKYEVTKQHTFVQIDNQGEMIKKWNGTNTVEEILAQLDVSQMQMIDDKPTMQDQETMWDTTEMKVEETMMDEMVEEKSQDMTAQVVSQEVIVGQYLTYDESIANNNQAKVLFFHANWCPSCKNADKNFQADVNNIWVDVVKVDYDTYADLKSQYGVTSQHTFVLVDESGTMVKRWYGSKDYTEILEELQS